MSLLDILQGTSNSVASNVSAPVDGLAWLLRKLGAPVPANPMGGSDWMAQKGLTRDPQNRNAGLLGEFLGMTGPMVAAAKAPQVVRGLLQMGDNAMAPRTLNPQTGAVVWHGSPHKFDAFDSSKIGTGEGAQAYGHGLYLAENPNVAKGYADQLSAAKGQAWEYDGMKVAKPGDAGNRWSLAGIDWLNRSGFDKQKAIENIKADWVLTGSSTKGKDFKELKKWIDDADLSKIQKDQSLYKVDLPDEHIAKMLDWDKPLSGQAPEVQAMAQSLMKGGTPNQFGWLSNADSPGGMAMTGKQFLNSLQGGESQMQKAGIPGIRYLDGGSRGAGTGSSNFVVFPGNEGLLQILERNGQKLK